jgi:hypothetical protein
MTSYPTGTETGRTRTIGATGSATVTARMVIQVTTGGVSITVVDEGLFDPASGATSIFVGQVIGSITGEDWPAVGAPTACYLDPANPFGNSSGAGWPRAGVATVAWGFKLSALDPFRELGRQTFHEKDGPGVVDITLTGSFTSQYTRAETAPSSEYIIGDSPYGNSYTMGGYTITSYQTDPAGTIGSGTLALPWGNGSGDGIQARSRNPNLGYTEYTTPTIDFPDGDPSHCRYTFNTTAHVQHWAVGASITITRTDYGPGTSASGLPHIGSGGAFSDNCSCPPAVADNTAGGFTFSYRSAASLLGSPRRTCTCTAQLRNAGAASADALHANAVFGGIGSGGASVSVDMGTAVGVISGSVDVGGWGCSWAYVDGTGTSSGTTYSPGGGSAPLYYNIGPNFYQATAVSPSATFYWRCPATWPGVRLVQAATTTVFGPTYTAGTGSNQWRNLTQGGTIGVTGGSTLILANSTAGNVTFSSSFGTTKPIGYRFHRIRFRTTVGSNKTITFQTAPLVSDAAGTWTTQSFDWYLTDTSYPFFHTWSSASIVVPANTTVEIDNWVGFVQTQAEAVVWGPETGGAVAAGLSPLTL